MSKWNDIYHITYLDEPVAIDITYIDEDEMQWQVVDIETGHLRLLNKLLHDDGKHQGDIEILLLADVDKIKADDDLQRQVVNYEDRTTEQNVFKKHGGKA